MFLNFIDNGTLIDEIGNRGLEHNFEKEIDEFSNEDIEEEYNIRELGCSNDLGDEYLDMIERGFLELLFDKISFAYPYLKRILDQYEIVLKK